MTRFIYERRGLTLIEILIAITIMGLVVGGAISIYLMSITAWKEGSVQIVLQREGSLAMEKIVRGVDGRNGVREANDVTCPIDTDIRYTSGIDGIQRRFWLNGSEIWYTPDYSIDEDGDPIVKNVSNLQFTVSGDIVTINLGTREMVRGKAIDVNLSTSVKLRN